MSERVATYWTATDKGDVRCRRLADLHYTRQTPGHPMWTRPGFNYVLYFNDGFSEAAWCWWRPKWETGQQGTQRKDGLRCIECTLFAHRPLTGEPKRILSSALVEDAVAALDHPAAAKALQLARPQDLLLITGVSSAKTSSRRSRHALPGRCYREAGWVDLPHRKGRADVWLQFRAA